MKFRHKILMVNIVILSLSLGVVGYLMTRRNFDLIMKTQLKNAIIENNLIQSYVEYELLGSLNSYDGSVKESLTEIGGRIMNGTVSGVSSFYIRYKMEFVYSSDGWEIQIPDTLFEILTFGGKNYIIVEEEGQYFIYITSYSDLDGAPLCVISKQDISAPYSILKEQIRYFRLLTVCVVLIASVIVYLLCKYLTGPLEKLNQATEKIADGSYDIQLDVAGTDEVGQLAASVQVMADAVLAHINELKDMVRRREQFVADFTHEIKTPITTMIACSDMMRSMEIPREEQIQALNYIFSEGKRLALMSQKLFQLIYLKQNTIERAAVNTSNLERDILRIATPILSHKKILLKTDIEPAVIMGDKELLNTVFLNLIDNAGKASKEGDSIIFKGHRILDKAGENGNQAAYELQVTDSGIGMSREEITRICDEFYMADKSRSRKEGGAGLGLSLASLILEKHRAVLRVESEIGKGTTIKVFFYDTEIKE